MSAPIAYCKIFPPIGIARVGNSEEPAGFFPGPDGLIGPPARYKDANGAVLRQAALFRIYAFDADDRVVGELTADNASLTWTVSLANKKAAWYEFDGAKNAMAQFSDPSGGTWPRRNSDWVEEDERLHRLVIDPGKPQSISGVNSGNDPANPRQYAFVGQFQKTVDVYLGELRTDGAGRLLVLGGRGHSAAIDESGKDVSGERWITHYANNDYWHDDTSDGPVSCAVEMDGRAIEVRGRAWVLVTPPDFAPAIYNIVTLFDVMENTALDHNLPHPGLPAPINPESIEFWRDIHPILSRANGYSWVSDLGLRGHAKGKGGDFTDPQLLAKLADPRDEDGKLARQHIFGRIRKPPQLVSGQPEAVAQANGNFMPALSGDEGDTTTGNPDTWLSVTVLQYRRLQQWAENRFRPGQRSHSPLHKAAAEVVAVAGQPALLTRTVLDACAGGAFFPGIEMTAIAHLEQAYAEAFRLSDKLEAGDVTKFMAVPWQADFFECNTHWWPAQRPDSVITARTARELRHAFAYERKQGLLESVMLIRRPWARGVDGPRPDPAAIERRLFPPPNDGERLDSYIKRLTQGIVGALAVLTSAAARVQEALAERVPTPGRVQFVVQEQFDVYAGRYFHFHVPSVEAHLAASKTKDRTRREPARPGPVLRTAEDLSRRNKDYVAFIRARLADYVAEVIGAATGEAEQAATFYDRLTQIAIEGGGALGNGPGGYEASIRKDFDIESREFADLRILDMAQCAIDLLYRVWSACNGDNGMVGGWSKLGFVVEQALPAAEGPDAPPPAMAAVETERPRLEGMPYRDYYFMLCNIDKFPEMYEYSATIVEKLLHETRHLIEQQILKDQQNEVMELYFDYDRETFAAKLEEIYEYFREQGVNTKPWEVDESRDDMIAGFVQNAPFNQNDGAWLRFVANAGPTDKVRGLLFDVWSDEYGNGDPALHHGNLYTTFLRSLNIVLPDITSREYADYNAFTDDLFPATVLELAISQNSDRYFPEILGMTLMLEWEVLSLVPGVKRYDYHGFNSQFWRMHVGIDNAVDGHGAKAREATALYLDNVLKESGLEAMQREWKRIWTGFVAFATAGYNYMGSDTAVAKRRPQTIYDRMTDMIGRKQHYGSLNHGDKRLGVNRINDWFDDSNGFIDELAHSSYVVPGNPDASRLMTYLTTFNGPMYEVFNAEDLALWRSWIQWLAREGDTSAVKLYQSKAESMLLLLQDLRSAMLGTDGHHRFRLEGKSLHDWVSGDLIEFMRALGRPDNQWVVPFDAGSSPLVRDFAAGANRMALTLDQRFPGIGNQVGRLIVVRWINAGCPIPGEEVPRVPVQPPRAVRRRVSVLEAYGMGAVH
jgi:hypothetical protein